LGGEKGSPPPWQKPWITGVIGLNNNTEEIKDLSRESIREEVQSVYGAGANFRSRGETIF